jgi:hypothetical protein
MADNSTKITREIQTVYMATIRRKLGEFMLVIRDLINRDVISSDNHSELPDKSNIVKIISAASESSTSNWADNPEINYLSVLLYNNGYPVQIIAEIGNASPQNFPENTYFDNGNALYKMYIVYTDTSGGGSGTRNHYTIAIPTNLEALLGKSQLTLEKVTSVSTMKIGELELTKYKIPGDGHCFYTAIATWCVLYGLEKHLENLSYNIPFVYDQDSHNENFKVMPTSNIPVHMGDLQKFKDTAVEIAKKMINKIKPAEDGAEGGGGVSPAFGEEKDIINSEEYKAYLTKIKDDKLHCNKYKGNKEETQSEEKE